MTVSMLTEPLPLTTMSQLGDFADAGYAPQRYGDLRKRRFRLLRLSSTDFLAAGHPMEITRAFTGDLETEAFDYSVKPLAGVSCTVVRYAAPVPLDVDASASGIGKRNAVTGALIENPADILTDLLALAGRDDAWWGQLRAEASAAGIALAGSITDATVIRDALDGVTDSCGAIWCPGMARLYPTAFAGFQIPLDRFSASNLQVSASLQDTGDILRLAFDYDEVEGKSMSFVQLEASPQRYGGVIVDLDMPMLRATAAAEAIGRRVLGWYAGERYSVSFTTPATPYVRPGTWARLTDHPSWPFDQDPDLMLTNVTLSGNKRWASVTAETMVTTPTITLTKHSLGSDRIGSGGVEVDTRNGIATFTVFDNDGKPFPGIYAALDGSAPKKTDGQGQVAFVITQHGVHELDLTSADGSYLPQSLQVTL